MEDIWVKLYDRDDRLFSKNGRCLRNARAFPLLPAALASLSFGFVLVRVRKLKEATYESYMNPEPGFLSGPGDSVDAD